MKYTLLLLILMIQACGGNNRTIYDHDIGYIDPVNSLGPANFETCGSRIFQYYNSLPAAGYKYGKNALRDSVMQHFKKVSDDSGYLIIRFVINCKGLAGRYEIVESDLNFNPNHFSENVKTMFLEIVINHLKEWNPVILEGQSRDAYMYLNFKMKNGEIVEILP